MIKSDSIANISKALLAVQQLIEPVKKDGSNPHFKSTYTTLNAMQEYVIPILNSSGLVLLFGGSEKTVSTCIMHPASGEFIEVEYPLILPDVFDREGRSLGANAQHVGSAISYLRRYGLAAILAISQEDDDGEGAVQGHRARANAPQSQSRQAPPPQRTQQRAPQGVQSVAEATGHAPHCPKCGGPMWDNRARKTNPRAPDFKCKQQGGDPQCDGVIWPKKDGDKAPPPQQEPQYEEQPYNDQDDDLPF